MNKQKFEVWESNGIPQDAPVFIGESLQQVRDYLEPSVYLSEIDNKYRATEGKRVFYGDAEIPLDAIFSDDDFYSSEEWKKIVGE